MSTCSARRRLLALAVAGSLVPLAVAAPASAAIPAPTNLSPSGTSSSHTPILSWTKVSGGARYEVQVDNDADFGSPLFTASTTNGRVVPDKVLPAGEVSWRVRALDSRNVASAWATRSVVIGSVASPTPKSPTGGVALAQPDEPPLFTWTAVQGAVKYTVQVDETDDFTTPISTTETQTTSLVSPSPLATGAYFWRVKASLATGIDSEFSDAAAFSLSALEPVTIISPLDSSELEDVVLRWQAVAGASHYEVEVATDADFNTKLSGIPAKIHGTRYSPAVTFDNDQYFWRARAVDTAGNKTPWPDSPAQFNRVWPDRPTPVYPLGEEGSPTSLGGSADGDNLYFQWTPIHHASQYELQVGTDPNFSPGTYQHCVTGGTTYTAGNFRINTETGLVAFKLHDLCYPSPGTVSYWRVRALDLPSVSPSIESLFSEPQAFVSEGIEMTGLSPAAGADGVDVPTLSWGAVPGAKEYAVTIRNRAGSTIKSVATPATSYTPVAIPKLTAAQGPYTWSITAKDGADRPLTVTHQRTFNVSGDTLTPSGTALAPHDVDDSSRAPALSWEPHEDADHYRLFVRAHGSSSWLSATTTDVLDKKLPYPAVTDTSTRFHLRGTYDWYVKAYASDGSELGEGDIGTFTITEIDDVTSGRIALNGKTLDEDRACTDPDTCADVPATPVLDWEPVPDAAFYLVYLSQDENFTNLVEPRTLLGATSQTRFTPTFDAVKAALADNTTDKPYWWVIRPCKSANACGPNPESVPDQATNRFRKKSPAVKLLGPDDEATITTADVSLDWQDYLTTSGATTWEETGETSPQAARAYRVQVDNDASFASPIETVVVDQSTYTSAATLYPEGILYWRVQAIDADENPLTWSERRSFTKATAKVALKAPLDDARVDGTTAFSWNSQAFVGTYQIEVYANEDTAASAGNRLFTATGLKQPSYVWNKPIPASGQPYVWRVRRMDPLANAGPWSSWGRFRSAGAVPTLDYPATSAYQSAASSLFTWSAVPGAATYTLESRNTSSTGTLTGTPKPTPATAWAPTMTVPDGVWEWRVTAKDAAGGAIGTSGWRRFIVDTVRPSVIAKSPATRAYRTANFVATFSEPVKGVSTSTMRIRKSTSSAALSAKVTLDSTKRKAILNPSANLTPGAYYVITVYSGITDMVGNRAVAYSWKVKAY